MRLDLSVHDLHRYLIYLVIDLTEVPIDHVLCPTFVSEMLFLRLILELFIVQHVLFHLCFLYNPFSILILLGIFLRKVDGFTIGRAVYHISIFVKKGHGPSFSCGFLIIVRLNIVIIWGFIFVSWTSSSKVISVSGARLLLVKDEIQSVFGSRFLLPRVIVNIFQWSLVVIYYVLVVFDLGCE